MEAEAIDVEVEAVDEIAASTPVVLTHLTLFERANDGLSNHTLFVRITNLD